MLFLYRDFISLPNLFQAWNEFKVGKRRKTDVMLFERFLEENLFNLHLALKNKTYRHGNYHSFYVHDPKLRHIHKATVADRVVHHLLYKYLYEVFDKSFIHDSYSCRLEKGTHKGVGRLGNFTRIVSKNYIRDSWVLKLDIKKFFANVDHKILMVLLKQKVKDPDILRLLANVIDSFHSEPGEGKGIPLGNLTSQVFANIYMNDLDQFIKHEMKIKYYLRYADDFVILSANKRALERLVVPLSEFLKDHLNLELHPDKIIFRRLDWGIDFLGYIVLPHYVLPRTKTKKRIFTKLKEKIGTENFNQSLQSYLGYLQHANSFKVVQQLKNQIWLWR
ncbi:MAG: Uncharacterized protein G01um10147_818 [Microgenomates group bacterium Gr01-1014_7]|nr:MAG: Uncharacterized protein G01um10147_818 [Microgenomates group bacterium Gr01-1014_7]